MGKVIVTDSTMSAIASAIRGKAGTASMYTPAQMVSAITNLPSGASVSALTVTENGTYSASGFDGYNPVTVNVSGGGGGFSADDIAERTISGTMAGSASMVGSYAFNLCDGIVSANFPNATVISMYGFANCSSLTTAYFQNVVSIEASAFVGCKNLVNISFPSARYISNNAFTGTGLSFADFPAAVSLHNYAFYRCSNLSYVSMPNISTIGTSAFMSCENLKTVNISTAKTISNYAFQYCGKLESIDCPSLTSVGYAAFLECKKLSFARMPLVSNISTSTFSGCEILQSLRLDSVRAISASAFNRCFILLSLYLLGSSVATLSNVNAFGVTPISTYTTSTGGVHGSIFVRASLYQDWITKANWSVYSSRFVSLTDEEIEALDAQ